MNAFKEFEIAFGPINITRGKLSELNKKVFFANSEETNAYNIRFDWNNGSQCFWLDIDYVLKDLQKDFLNPLFEQLKSLFDNYNLYSEKSYNNGVHVVLKVLNFNKQSINRKISLENIHLKKHRLQTQQSQSEYIATIVLPQRNLEHGV